MDWWKLPATALADAYRAGQLSPVEVAEGFVARCEALNPALNAVVTLDAAALRRAARASDIRWRSGAPLSLLDGVPLTVKDSLLVGGMRATWGSRLYEQFVPVADELPVARLRAAGALIAAKTNAPEFTLQGYTGNALFGITRNPWDPALTPGGSSGGAVAAVAAGLGPLALGTDGGGSTRRPAAHTGLVGFKPSRGRIARAGSFPPILLDYEVVGLIARTVSDVEAALVLLGDADARDAASLPFADAPYQPQSARSCRILYAPRTGDSPVDPEVARSVEAAARALQGLGHLVEEGRFELPQMVNQHWPVISQVGLAWLLEQHPGWQARVGPALAAMAEAGAALPATRYFEALDAVARARLKAMALFRHHDLVLTPSVAALPWPAAEAFPARIDGRDAGPRGHAVFTAFANALGLPAISVPCMPSSAGLPVGFQLVGDFAEDALVCAIARQYEAAAPWAARWPGLCRADKAA